MYSSTEVTIERAKRFQTLRYELYRCPSLCWTIGYGHNLTRNGIPEFLLHCWDTKIFFNSINRFQAELLLEIDIETIALKEALEIFGSDFICYPEPIQTVILDMLFDMGKKKFLTFEKMIKAVKNYLWIEAALEIRDSLYYRTIEKIVDCLKKQGRKNTFHRAEENIALVLKVAN